MDVPPLLTCLHLRRSVVLSIELYGRNSLFVATPIGNLKDISLRAIETLRAVDVIACEDTRHTRKLLNHYDISRPLVSYHEHNEETRSVELIERLNAGESVAVVSDAGRPGINDPGFVIVQKAIEAGVDVVPIPGPVAFASAITASGLPTESILFAGFLIQKRRTAKATFGTWIDPCDAGLLRIAEPPR